MSHTPGPWAVADYLSRPRGEAIGIEGPAQSIAEVHDHADTQTAFAYQQDERSAEAIANAHLIAAAPDLLAALEALGPWMGRAVAAGAFDGCVGNPTGAINQAVDAIARATGA